MDADRYSVTARQGSTPSLAPPADLLLDGQTEHEASLDWFERRLRCYTDQIVRGISAEQRRSCDDLESFTELSPAASSAQHYLPARRQSRWSDAR